MPPSVTSTLGLRYLMRVTRKAATAKVAALRKMTIACEPTSNSTAPIAGPTTTTRLSIVDCSALAATSSLSGTSVGTVAPTAGISKTAVAEVSAAHSRPSATGPWASDDNGQQALPEEAEAVREEQQPEAIRALDDDTAVRAQQERRQEAHEARRRRPR